jgi:hypothetical protein
VIVIDEYLAISVVGGDWPEGLPDSEDLLLPPSRHWRLLQRLHSPGTGQISRALSLLSPAGRDGIRFPHPEVLQVLDSRPLLDEAAQLAAQYGGGWLVAETLAAGLTFGRTLWFGTEANVGRIVTSAAGSLGIQVHVLAA